ncbi:hypothetical protein BS47DRAFT_99215 [Hydnum rufescens UP504]|uniref:Secreted protein n=1 Tax=Hydnum rufescens UP504 TaxID=1448309 RepID=A0A9P6AQD1_9AGAM|nr:hypothetical protein BS47DRAFT_99215 [Hydnum rufescens UP504]
MISGDFLCWTCVSFLLVAHTTRAVELTRRAMEQVAMLNHTPHKDQDSFPPLPPSRSLLNNSPPPPTHGIPVAVLHLHSHRP